MQVVLPKRVALTLLANVQGVSLRESFDSSRRFALGGVVSIMVQLLDALHAAHEQGVWQREIEPANIIIMSDGKLKVADFGIDRNGSSVPAQIYMAPEQHNGGPVDSRAEIFSAGVVLYQLLTGRHPFNGDAEAIARKICHEAPLPPSQVNPERCATRFDAVVMKALARKPAERHQSAQAFRDELLAAYAGQASPAAAEETINSEIALPSTHQEPSRVQQPTSELPSAPAQFSRPHPDPVPDEPFHSAEPSQSSSPEPPHSTPWQSSGSFPEQEHYATHQPSETPQTSRPAPPPPTGCCPDPAQPDASTAPALGWSWDAAVLKQVERQLARFIGPVAKLMVRRAAASTADIDELYRILADKLTERDLHAVLLYGWLNKTLEFRPREMDATSGPRADDQAPATGPAAQSKLDASAIWPPGWDAAVLAQVERQLARFVGPVARLLVRRGAAGTTDIDTLYSVLAGQLRHGQERAAFLAGRDRLQGVPPRRIDEASALGAAQATDSDHEGFPDVNGDADGETPRSPSTT